MSTLAVRLLYTAEAVAERVRSLAREIGPAFGGEFLMVIVLKGAFVFGADLLRALHDVGRHPRVGFLALSSYGQARKSSGQVRVAGELPEGVHGSRVLLVDDVLDTGRTLAFARDLLAERGAVEVRTCVLLDKPARREVPFAPDFVGFALQGDPFVVGYGIDYAEQFRDLPYIAALDDAMPQRARSGRRRRAPGR